jgi:EAL domain-containing protein (putative c-di-GMP-specific phosphodiesterase class I)
MFREKALEATALIRIKAHYAEGYCFSKPSPGKAGNSEGNSIPEP